MKERSEDVLAEARRYLADLVAFEGTQFTAPEAIVEHSTEEPIVDTLEAFRQQICDCTRCRLGATRQQFVFGSGDLRGRHYVHRRGSGGRGRSRRSALCGESWSTAD